jgi:hypothetical protein
VNNADGSGFPEHLAARRIFHRRQFMWVPGGELIRYPHNDLSLRKKPGEALANSVPSEL